MGFHEGVPPTYCPLAIAPERLACRRPANRMIDHPTDDDVPEDCGFSYYVGRSVGWGLLIAFAFGAIVLVFLAFKAMLWVLAW